jgi:multicomponent Na+:H+ antiporter subunit B
MNSIILQSASRYLFVPLILISLFVLYRGHNLPGGGFIGGLLAASAVTLTTLASGVQAARKRLRCSPLTLIAAGLGVALSSAFWSLFAGKTFFSGLWLPSFSLPLLGKVHLGTPLIFDVGVYLAVVGFALAVIFELEEPT